MKSAYEKQSNNCNCCICGDTSKDLLYYEINKKLSICDTCYQNNVITRKVNNKWIDSIYIDDKEVQFKAMFKD